MSSGHTNGLRSYNKAEQTELHKNERTELHKRLSRVSGRVSEAMTSPNRTCVHHLPLTFRPLLDYASSPAQSDSSPSFSGSPSSEIKSSFSGSPSEPGPPSFVFAFAFPLGLPLPFAFAFGFGAGGSSTSSVFLSKASAHLTL